MRLIYLGSNFDPEAQRFLDKWIREAGGRIELEELLKKYEEKFKCRPHIYMDDEVRRMKSSQVFEFKDGMVSFLPTVH